LFISPYAAIIAFTFLNSCHLDHGWPHCVQRREKKLTVQIFKGAIAKWGLNDIEIIFLLGITT
jgi:hypothetical protein